MAVSPIALSLFCKMGFSSSLANYMASCSQLFFWPYEINPWTASFGTFSLSSRLYLRMKGLWPRSVMVLEDLSSVRGDVNL